MVDFNNNLHNIFSADGLLYDKLPGFEFREAQYSMANAVYNALKTERHLIIEAGTGVGKSLAYLVPLCLWLSNTDSPRAIIATYTKALQKQLFEKELPFVKEHLFPHLKYAISFGSENYLCLRRLGQAKQYGLFDATEIDSLSIITDWVKGTHTGLLSEVLINITTRGKVKREPDLCSGKKCSNFIDCYYQTAKAIERKSHIIIANHHLYFAHVASNYNVLPDAPHVIFDEAHEIEGVATNHLGLDISTVSLRHLLDAIISPRGKGLLLKLKWLDPNQVQELSALVDQVRRKGNQFFLEMQNVLGDQRCLRLNEECENSEELCDALFEMGTALEHLIALSGDEEEEQEITAITQRTLRCREHVNVICNREYENAVYWASQDTRTVRLSVTPLNIADILKTTVFDTLSSSVLTSGTMAVNNQFDFMQSRLGLTSTETVLYASPFDYKNQTGLFIPDTLPEPGSNQYPDAIAHNLEEILRHTRGNTLALFTSHALLNEVAAMIDIDFPILKQDNGDNFALLEEFRNHQPSALFGTYTFWQGIDLPGNILRCVVITKLPFAVPTEPVLEARMEKIRSSGGDPFHEYQVPSAVITFRQGFGRLIRSRADHGLVAILDSRILNKPYGRYFLNSLPDMDIINNINGIKKYLN